MPFINSDTNSSLTSSTYTAAAPIDIALNTNVSEYQIYMQRRQAREKQGDQIRGAVKEINTLKKELREIKELIKEVIKR